MPKFLAGPGGKEAAVDFQGGAQPPGRRAHVVDGVRTSGKDPGFLGEQFGNLPVQVIDGHPQHGIWSAIRRGAGGP